MRLRRILGAGLAASVVAGPAVVGTAPAGAVTVSCGQTITQSTVVSNNLVNCPGDGLVITGNNIVLDLGGHTISGRNTTNTTAQEQVGIHLINASGVTVRNGTVTNFDAGVAVEGGAGNTITNLTVRDNFNHSTATGAMNPCSYGDGITVFDSDNNQIRSNRATGNGPFSGIALVGDSDGNVVSGNQAVDNNVDNIHPAFFHPVENREGLGPCGPFTLEGTVGRPYQDIGIRVEGPGADNNRVHSNQVVNNMLNGITIHGYVCHPPGGRPPFPNNGGNVISSNYVQGNGFGDPGDRQHGIAVLSQGPTSVVCVAFGNTITGNVSDNNGRDGIHLGGRGSHSNTISSNTVRGNGRDGIRVTGPSTGPGGSAVACGPNLVSPCPGAINNTITGNTGSGNGEHDGDDRNPNCDNNAWRGNRFGTVNQACVATGGTGTVTP